MAGSEPRVLAEGERRFLEALNALGVRYLLVGMSAALLQGARGATEHLDLWFENLGDPRIGEAARAAGSFFVTRAEPPLLGGMSERFDVVATVSGLPDFVAEYDGACAMTVEGVELRVLPLERIITSKRAANRVKDQAVLPALELARDVIKRGGE